MQKTLPLMTALCFMLLLTGCSGEKADENRSPETIRQEAAAMRVSRLKKTLMNYNKAIESKEMQLKIAEEKLSKIPLEEQFSEEAKGLRSAIDQYRLSLHRLRTNRQYYADTLQKKIK